MTGYLFVRPKPYRDGLKNKVEWQRLVYKLDVLGAPYEPAEDGFIRVYINKSAHFFAIKKWNAETVVERQSGRRYSV